MFFTQIELHNFGIYKGTHLIELNNALDKRNVTLIGGMNGRGKTTILDAIFLTFYGKRALPYIQDGRKRYDTFLREYVNKSATDNYTYVSVTFVMDDNTEIKVIRKWSIEESKSAENLFVLRNGQEDHYLSENWNYYIEEVLPFGISRFFFFDNEKISQIADDESFDEIKDSIKAVMGVSIIDKVLDDIQKIARDKQTSTQTIETIAYMKEKEENEAAIAKVTELINNARRQRAQRLPQLEIVQAKLETTEENFWKQGGHLGVKREEIEKEKADLKEEENVLKQKIIDLAINPATPLAMCDTLLKQVYNEAKITQAQTVLENSKALIEDIIERLTQKVSKLLEKDRELQVRVKNMIVEELEDYSNGKTDVGRIGLTPVSIMLIERLLEGGIFDNQVLVENIIKQIEENENALLQIDTHLNSNAEKMGALELISMIRDLERSATALEIEITKIDESIQSFEHQCHILEVQRQKIIKRIALIDDTADDNARIISYAAKTEAVMTEFKHRLQTKKVSELENNITKCFRFLTQKENIITKVEIDPTNLDITLRDYTGGILLKSQLSAGEKQMFAISIIWGLALSSGYKLPVVIDTPMARLDSAHRHNFINRYLPNASSQVIVLSTDEEVYGRYLYQIQEHVNSYYTLQYNAVEKCTCIVPGYFEEAIK
ncbi:MAG: DNA sulfur modification protein DndD [Tissierellaceae bacterium]|nr:DNA sulfur modification protein DndD [Tissierellaceae bacterium]